MHDSCNAAAVLQSWIGLLLRVEHLADVPERLSRGTTLNALVEVADLKALQERVAVGAGTSPRRSAPVTAAAELKQDVFDHEIVLTTALNQVGAFAAD